MDCCKTSRKKYSFKAISDLYSVLWGKEFIDIVDSSETIISTKQNIVRVFKDLKKKQRGRPCIDWDKFKEKSNDELEELSYRVATIGNYMPVPACEQRILNLYFRERFDCLLTEIRNYYINNTIHSYFEKLKKWLELFKDENNKPSWEKFVISNFLKGSFVDEKLEVVSFDGTAKQLSDFLYYGSVIIIIEYEKRYKELSPSI